MESLRFVLQSVKKVSDNIGGLCAFPENIKKPVQEREVFIVGRAAFLSLFCFFFLLIFYYYAKRSFAETVVNP